MHVYITQATVGTLNQIDLQLPDTFPVGRPTFEVRFPDAMIVPPLILTIPRPQAPALPEAACWPVESLAFLHPPQWRERAAVETDETLLQPVAYGLLLNDAGHAWCYQRTGGDARVDGRFSCGVGGHVDTQDAVHSTPSTFDPESTLRTAWLRELAEELHASTGVHLADVRLHGLVYEGLSAIGRVHLGVVFIARWCGPTPPQPAEGEALRSMGFMPLSHIAIDPRFELWSRLVAQHLLVQSGASSLFCRSSVEMAK